MGDLLRRLCYPLVLPFIVGAVYLHAWAARQESRAFPTQFPAPPGAVSEAEAHVVTVPGPAPGYRLFTDDDSVASVDVDEE